MAQESKRSIIFPEINYESKPSVISQIVSFTPFKDEIIFLFQSKLVWRLSNVQK